MKDDMDENDQQALAEKALFAVIVGLSLIGIIYCVVTSVIDNVKVVDANIFDIHLFYNMEDDYEYIQSLSSVNIGQGYNMPVYDREGTIQCVSADVISVESEGISQDYILEGIEIPEENSLTAIIGERLEKGDFVFINISDANKIYLYFEDGTMVQKWLLLNGYVAVSDSEFDKKAEFEEVEAMAKENCAGIWEKE